MLIYHEYIYKLGNHVSGAYYLFKGSYSMIMWNHVRDIFDDVEESCNGFFF